MRDRMLGFKNKNNYLRHLTDLFNLQCSQFVYTGLPETIPAEFLEFFLAINGTVGIGKVKELGETSELYATVGAYNGNINGYLPIEYTGAVTGLGEISGVWSGDKKNSRQQNALRLGRAFGREMSPENRRITRDFALYKKNPRCKLRLLKDKSTYYPGSEYLLFKLLILFNRL